MADFITQFTANEAVSRENFNNRITQANTAMINIKGSIDNHQTDNNNPHKTTLPQVGGSGENLIINWYLKNPINQGGLTSWNANGYMLDMWKLERTPGATYFAELNATGLILGSQIAIAQRQEKFAQLAGRQVTASALIDDALYSVTFTWVGENAYTVPATFSNGFRFAYSGQDPLLQLHNFSGSPTAVIQAIKFELGSEQTLAHQDANGNWVLNDPPPNPQQEQAKCQRYQIALTQDIRFRCVQIQPNYIDFFVPTATPLRAIPAIVGEFVICTLTGTQQTGFIFAVAVLDSAGVLIRATKTSHGLSDAFLNVVVKTILNANL